MIILVSATLNDRACGYLNACVCDLRDPDDCLENVSAYFDFAQYKNYADIIFNEYRSIIKDIKRRIPFKQKMKYIFGPPGYSHDGSSKTAKEMQKSNE